MEAHRGRLSPFVGPEAGLEAEMAEELLPLVEDFPDGRKERRPVRPFLDYQPVPARHQLLQEVPGAVRDDHPRLAEHGYGESQVRQLVLADRLEPGILECRAQGVLYHIKHERPLGLEAADAPPQAPVAIYGHEARVLLDHPRGRDVLRAYLGPLAPLEISLHGRPCDAEQVSGLALVQRLAVHRRLGPPPGFAFLIPSPAICRKHSSHLLPPRPSGLPCRRSSGSPRTSPSTPSSWQGASV